MKRLFLILMLFSGLCSAQNFFERGQGMWISDSLWNDIYVSGTDTTAAQSSVEISLNFDYDWAVITAIDSGTTYTDSCIVEYGSPTFARNSSGKIVPTDTTWQTVQFMRDSSWTNTNLIPDNASVKSYRMFVGDYEVIRMRMTNAVAVENRIWKFQLQASRKR